MKIVEPSVEVFFHYPHKAGGGRIEPAVFLELTGRTCYKSEDKITTESAPKFIAMLRKRGHHAMLEHCVASVKFVCDRGVTHELVRHRLAAYAQECLTGDTCIATAGSRRRVRLDVLAKRDATAMGREYNRRLQTKTMRRTGKISWGGIEQVWPKGRAHVFEVETKSGYKITATMAHRFATPHGKFKRLAELKVGDSVLVNGRPCLCRLSGPELRRKYLREGKAPAEIAQELGCPYRSVVEYLKRLGVFQRRLNDHNKEKYQRNHTAASLTKMRQKIREQYARGRRVWNAGMHEGDDPRMDRILASLRRKHWNQGAPRGEKNSQWRGGVSQRYYARLMRDATMCALCSKNGAEVHHKNGNRKDNRKENLLRVCAACHKRLHFGWHVGIRAVPDEIVRVAHVGVREVFDVQMRGLTKNFVANGFVVHNSTRYCNYSADKFGNEISVIQPPFKDETQSALCLWDEAMRKAEEIYQALIALGESPQIARSVLPTCLKTEIWCTANLREWMHIFDMRFHGVSGPPHPQMVELMTMAYAEFSHVVPELFPPVTTAVKGA